MSWVTDITHFGGVLDPSSRAPGPAKLIARFFGSIVQAATAWPPGEMIDSAIHCRRKPKRKACAGRIRLVLVEHDESGNPDSDVRILWECPLCKDNGVIRNWKGTDWDLSDVERDDGFWDHETLHLTLSDEEYLALREELAHDRKLLALVIVARSTDVGPMMEMTLGETHRLVEGVFQVMKVGYGKRKRLLEGVMNKLHEVLPGAGPIQ